MSIQTVIRITTKFNEVIELLQIEEEFRIDTRELAPKIGLEHESLIKNLETYQEELRQFGDIRFQIGKPQKGSTGGRPVKYGMLNRLQVLFAITLSRNTEQVVRWKMAIIDALDQLEQMVSGKQQLIPAVSDKKLIAPPAKHQKTVTDLLSPGEQILRCLKKHEYKFPDGMTKRDFERYLKSLTPDVIRSQIVILTGRGELIREQTKTGRTWRYSRNKVPLF